MSLRATTGSTYDYVGLAPTPPTANSSADLPDPFFAPGTWTLSSPGSSDVMPFTVPLAITPTISITNVNALTTIDTGQDLVVTWSTQGLAGNEMATVSLLSTVPCRAPALAGSLTIPAGLLLSMAPPGVPVPPGPWLQVYLSPQPGPQSTFRVSRSDGTSIPGVFVQTSSEGIDSLIEPSAPAIFPGGIANQDGTQNSASNGSVPGSIIAVWATGLSGNVAVSAIIGGESVTVPTYAGPAPGLMGVQQVNLLVPSGLLPGTTQLSVCRTPPGGMQVCSASVPFTIE